MTLPPAVASQREAQETLYHYMRTTLQLLPYDVILDNERYGGGGGVVQCDDRIDQENAPITYYDHRDLQVSPGIDYNDLISKVGDIWKGWGWKVEERNGIDKPNRYGTSPDGYGLSIQTAHSYPPIMEGSSPCFPSQLRDDHVSVPEIITRDGLQYGGQPSVTPTGWEAASVDGGAGVEAVERARRDAEQVKRDEAYARWLKEHPQPVDAEGNLKFNI